MKAKEARGQCDNIFKVHKEKYQPFISNKIPFQKYGQKYYWINKGREFVDAKSFFTKNKCKKKCFKGNETIKIEY